MVYKKKPVFYYFWMEFMNIINVIQMKKAAK